MDFSYLLRVLLKRKWYILGVTLLSIVAAFIFLSFKKHLYESTAQYSTGFTSEKVQLVDGTSAVDLYGAEVKFNNVIETFKSPKVVGMLSYSLLLHDLNNPQNAYVKVDKEQEAALYKSINIDTLKRVLRDKLFNSDILNSTDKKEAEVLNILRFHRYDYNSIIYNLGVRRVEGTDYINVTFYSENPELSAAVVNTIGQNFINYYKNLTQQRGEESATNIRELVQEQQKKVDSLNNILFKIKVKQGSIDPVSVSTSAMETVKDLETRLADAKANLYTSGQTLDFLKQRREKLTSSSANNSNDDILTLRNRKKELIDENIKRGGHDPDLQKKIDDITTDIIIKSGNKTSTAKIDNDLQDLDSKISEFQANYNASNLTIGDLESKINQYRGLTNVSPGSSVLVDQLQSQLRIENKALENIQEKYNQAQGLVKDNPAVNIKQTLIGQPSAEPEPAKNAMIMGLAGVATFFVSSLFFLLIAIFDPSIRTPSQFTKLVRQPLLAAVTFVNFKNQRLSDIMMGEEGYKSESENLFKQNLRKLRFEITNSGKKVFLFSSTKSGDGKSTVMQALAYSFLLTNKKVLLIDTNFSNNDITRTFGAAPVVEKEMMSNANQNEWKRYISNTSFKNLDIIGCQGGNYTPSEVLKLGNILEQLNNLTTHYDYIFLEGAAMNQSSDTLELTKYVHSLILVFSAKSAIGPSDLESFNLTKNLNGHFLGTVLNKVQPQDIDL